MYTTGQSAHEGQNEAPTTRRALFDGHWPSGSWPVENAELGLCKRPGVVVVYLDVVGLGYFFGIGTRRSLA